MLILQLLVSVQKFLEFLVHRLQHLLILEHDHLVVLSVTGIWQVDFPVRRHRQPFLDQGLGKIHSYLVRPIFMLLIFLALGWGRLVWRFVVSQCPDIRLILKPLLQLLMIQFRGFQHLLRGIRIISLLIQSILQHILHVIVHLLVGDVEWVLLEALRGVELVLLVVVHRVRSLHVGRLRVEAVLACH